MSHVAVSFEPRVRRRRRRHRHPAPAGGHPHPRPAEEDPLYQASTPSSTAWCKRSRRRKPRPSPAAPTRWPRCTPTGSRSTTARPMACTPATASSSTTRVPRGETFVTRKITRAIARIALAPRLPYLGNMSALRDWGHAGLRRDAVDDAAAGQARGLRHRHRRAVQRARQFVEFAAAELGVTCRVQGPG